MNPETVWADILNTTFRITGVTRTIKQVLYLDAATWQTLAPGEEPAACGFSRTRLLTQREIEVTSPNGTVQRYWETQRES